MNLSDWLEEKGRGAAAELTRKARVSSEAVRLGVERKLHRVAVAKRISDATGGEVPAREMVDPSILEALDVPVRRRRS